MVKSAVIPHFIRRLKSATTVSSLWENADNSLTVKLRGGEDVVIYAIDDARLIVPTPLKTIVRRNTREHFHTLFVIAADALPPAGGRFAGNELQREALLMLFELYWGKVYAYRLEGEQLSVFPVYNNGWRAVYGDPVEIDLLEPDIVFLEMPFKGVFNVANFGGRFAGTAGEAASGAHNGAHTNGAGDSAHHGFDPLQACYALLGVGLGAEVGEIKRAYRRLARQYHPDTNPSPEANAMMQRLNEAYAKIMEREG